jgi:hypothetical protein
MLYTRVVQRKTSYYFTILTFTQRVRDYNIIPPVHNYYMLLLYSRMYRRPHTIPTDVIGRPRRPYLLARAPPIIVPTTLFLFNCLRRSLPMPIRNY